MKIGDKISVTVEAIANGFLVREERRSGYRGTTGTKLFYPSMKVVERELTTRMRAAAELEIREDAGEDF
jgi:hypothetical protein